MKKVIFYLMVLPMAIVALAGCSESKTNAKDLEGKWNIVEVKGTKVSQENMPFMQFNIAENKVNGNAGCNTFNSSFELKDDDVSAISFGIGMSTMMACLDMELESMILKNIELVKSVKAGKSANEMLLLDKDGNVLFVLAK